jgi:hypothetical protein
MSILTKFSSRIFILSYETLASYGALGSHKFLIPSRHYLDSRPLSEHGANNARNINQVGMSYELKCLHQCRRAMCKRLREEDPEDTAPGAGGRHRDTKARGTRKTIGSPDHPFRFLDLPAGEQ